MTNSHKYITWQPVLTDHQAYTFQALGQEANVPVVAYVTTMEDATRKTQGWTDTQVSSIERRLIPKRGFLRYCYQQLREHQTETHFFGSPFQQPRLILCMGLAAWLGINFYLISEPYSPGSESYFTNNINLISKLKAILRPLVYRIYALIFHRYFSGIFAISRLALTQYEKAGVPTYKLFPFGYFVPCDNKVLPHLNSSELPENNGLRIIFVGNLIRRKGIDLLYDAALQLNKNDSSYSIDIYGAKDDSCVVPNVENVHYRGLIPFGQAQSVIAQYDVLVLPSRYDGWGVVVNEALCAGVPVVCSDKTGAGVVLEKFGAGLSFASGNSHDLSEILFQLMRKPMQLISMRKAVSRASATLHPNVAGHYMFEVIQNNTGHKASIRSPWY